MALHQSNYAIFAFAHCSEIRFVVKTQKIHFWVAGQRKFQVWAIISHKTDDNQPRCGRVICRPDYGFDSIARQSYSRFA